MKHHTKDKGDLAVLKVMAALGSQEFLVLTPITEHSPFDLVAYKDNTFLRIQVKYKTLKNNTISVDLRSSWADKRGCYSKPMDKSSIDLVAIYCPDTEECYFVKSKDCSQTLNLRVATPKNNQNKKIRLVKDYLKI